jgi:hypothetical protein
MCYKSILRFQTEKFNTKEVIAQIVVFWVVKLEVGINLDPEDGRSMFL